MFNRSDIRVCPNCDGTNFVNSIISENVNSNSRNGNFIQKTYKPVCVSCGTIYSNVSSPSYSSRSYRDKPLSFEEELKVELESTSDNPDEFNQDDLEYFIDSFYAESFGRRGVNLLKSQYEDNEKRINIVRNSGIKCGTKSPKI